MLKHSKLIAETQELTVHRVRRGVMQAHVWRLRMLVVVSLLCGLLCALVLAPSTQASPAAPGKKGRWQPPPGSISQLNRKAAAEQLEFGLGKARKAAPDTLRLAALRVAFTNLDFGESPPAELHDRFWFQTQFSYVREYFDAASLGATVVQVDVPDVVAMASHTQEYYGDFAHYDSLMIELLDEMIVQFDPSIDYRDYDGVILLHAGPGQESDLQGDSPNQIWSGYLDQARFTEQLSTPDSIIVGLPTQDGDHLVSDVIVLPEWEVQDLLNPNDTRLGHLGVYNHEVGQKLGMIPMFDPDPSPIPDSQGVGNFGVMGYGLWVANGFIPTLPGAFNRALMGWVLPRDVQAGEELLLRDYERGPADSVLVRVPISGREYFLVSYIVEDPDGAQFWVCQGDTIGYQPIFQFDDKNNNCRFDYEDTNMDGILSPGDLIDSYAGAEWDFFMTDLIGFDTAGFGYGLLVYHVDEQRLIDVLRGGSGSVQSDPRRKGVDVEEADGIEDLDRGADNARSFGSFEDYWICNQEFGPESTPSTLAVDGTPTGLRITLIDLPDSTATTAGATARVRVQRGTVEPVFAAPLRSATRRLPGWQSADLVVFPLATGRAAIVVPADSGRVFLLDEHLDEAPVSDGDPTTLLPWQVVPPPWAGRWSAPPVVGDLDGDTVAELIMAAEVDSAGTVITRVFAWRQDGSEFRDLDANSATNTGLFATLPGSTERLLVYDVQLDPGMEIVLATRSGTTTSLPVLEHPITAPWPCPSGALSTTRVLDANLPLQLPEGHLLAGGPIAVRSLKDPGNPVTGLGWVSCDPRTLAMTYWFDTVNCFPGPPPLSKDPLSFPLESAADADAGAQLLATDLDGDRLDEVVVVHTDGRIEVLGDPTSRPNIHRRARNAFADRSNAPLAVADVDGNGTLEILVSGEKAFHVLSLSGAELPGWPYPYSVDAHLSVLSTPGESAVTPLVADLDGDGKTEIMAPLAGGPLLVWDRSGQRRRELEATLPAWDADSPTFLVGGAGRPVLAGSARYERAEDFMPITDSLTTRSHTEIAIWEWPQLLADGVLWRGRGGDGTGAFQHTFDRTVAATANDASLGSFALGPNPAAQELRTRVQLTQSALVTCALFNLEGEIVQQQQRSGVTGELVEFVFDLRQMASSPYLARMQLSTGGQRVKPFVVRR